MNASYNSRKILRAAGAWQCGGALKFSGLSIDFYGMLWRGAQKKSNGYFSLTQPSKHERGRLPGLIQPFVDQMRRGNAHVNASRKTFKNIYAIFHTFHFHSSQGGNLTNILGSIQGGLVPSKSNFDCRVNSVGALVCVMRRPNGSLV